MITLQIKFLVKKKKWTVIDWVNGFWCVLSNTTGLSGPYNQISLSGPERFHSGLFGQSRRGLMSKYSVCMRAEKKCIFDKYFTVTLIISSRIIYNSSFVISLHYRL